MKRWYMSLPKYTKELKRTTDGQRVDKRYTAFARMLRQNIGGHELLFEKLPESFGYSEKFNLGLAENIAAAKTYYDSALSELKNSLVVKVKEIFISPSKQASLEMTSLYSVITDWCESLDAKVFEQLFPDGTEKCLGLFQSITHDEEIFIARLAKAITDLRVEDWDEPTVSRFLDNLKQFKNTAEQYHSEDTSAAEATTNTYQITFVGDDGQATTKRFDRIEYSKRGKLLFNAITADIESMGHSISEQEKRQILIEVLKELC